MSLINDALKRASKQQKSADSQQTISGTGSGAPMTPASSPDAASKHRLQNYLLVMVLVVCVLAPTWLIVKWENDRKQSAKATQAAAQPKPNVPTHVITPNTNVVTRPGVTNAVKPPTHPTNVVARTVGPTNAVAKPPVATNVVVKRMDAPLVTPLAVAGQTSAPPDSVTSTNLSRSIGSLTAVPPPKAAWPTLKLQGIFYRLRGPSVLMNGQTAKVGGEIDGVKIVEINRNDVKVEFHGDTNVIVMP